MTDDMWGTGDYEAVAEKVTSIADVLVRNARIEPGVKVLDVACGTGNAGIAAAKRGAQVTGLDLSPGLIATARRRGAAANVDVEWLEGDAQSLPFDDDSFDVVISAIGHMFAPDHRQTAAELRRVCRKDGRIAIACWTPEGAIGAMFKRLAEISPPPAGSESPLLWGTVEHVRELLGDGVDFERHAVEFEEPSPANYADFMLTSFPPLIAMRAQLGDEIVRETYTRWVDDVNEADDGTLRYRGEYLVAVT
ncbi:class I SAM-dependent methyltransferase [Mycolicibacterium sp. 120270]|uniref:class I SAM-dependent methyltransferase n=1 Tax=Mycolicibacterium sp. 120270 TaxID=3090600 RepID=UPI00299E8FEA|nr:class I SAM-dependent methyltransferase [Mycolicibacterium sp. 120270]MDX1886428.1 class I SAM-dependent methyltransferase [Mycolicibacterium sp. 120270]